MGRNCGKTIRNAERLADVCDVYGGIHSTITLSDALSPPYKQLSDWEKKATPWVVELRYAGRKMVTPFYTGELYPGEPTTALVVDALLTDAEATEYTFGEWCAEFGANTDSMSAHDTYMASRQLGGKFRKMMGAEYVRLTTLERL